MGQRVKVLRLFSILFLSFLLAGCSREKPEKKVVVSYVYCEGLPNMVRMNNEVIANFEKENPDIKIKAEWGVNFQKHLTMFAGGVSPDVSFWPWGAVKLVSKDVLLPLNDLIEKHGLDTSQYFKCMVEQYTYKGEIYLIPQQLKTIALIYNKDIFDEFKVPYPTEDWMWDDYYKTAKRLTVDTDSDGKRDYYGTQLPSPYSWIFLNNSDIFDWDKGKSLLNTKRTREALEFVIQLYKECCPSAGDIQAFAGYSGVFGIYSIEPFLTGKIAMVPAWSFMVRDTVKIKNFRWDVVSIPKAPDGKRHHMFADGGLCIAKGCTYPDEAFRFIKYYCSREGMIIYGRERNGVPAHIGAALETFPSSPHNLRWYVEAGKGAKPYYSWIEPTGEDITKDFYIQMDLVLLGKKSLDEMIKEVSASMERRYQEFLRKGIPIKLK